MSNNILDYWPLIVLAIWIYIVERRERKLSERVDWLQGELARMKRMPYPEEK